ncbi:hypothetical protein N7494_003117 [Penicillium frequentans]|uniref:Senescence domain-containing protein n=1 Tax=Penicillium frequentans TaxID=3151616 RepID=A0AAD6D560_9EURO|nr:hypothetical protein N7494_003117 [Penicillium glabrum]
MAGIHDPRLLYSITNIRAFHIQDGEEQELTPSGPQTLSLLMVPTTPSPSMPPYATGAGTETPEEDFYLHLCLPPELDLALPATTQIYHQVPDSYLIPRWDLAPGAFIRIQFPGIGSGPDKVTQDDIDTFETILAQCTAFLERAAAPSQKSSGKSHGLTAYNPADYAPGEGYISSDGPQDTHGKIVLVDEEDGSVVGELGDAYDVVEDPDVKPGSKRPVNIELPSEGEGNRVSISNVSEEYLAMSRHPAYKNSTIVQTSATASRLIVATTTSLANAITSGAESFTKKTKPNQKPLTFSDATHARIRKVGSLSTGAADLSARTLGQVERVAQNVGASLSRKDNKPKSFDKTRPPPDYKPGVLNKSLIAFNTLADGIQEGARNILLTGSSATGTMIGHKYGAEAGDVANNLTGGVKNVGLVYIDATGVSRRALLKSVAKGMVVGRMRDGKQVVVGGGDGGELPPDAHAAEAGPSTNPTPPPAYGASGTTSLGGTPMSMSGGKR